MLVWYRNRRLFFCCAGRKISLCRKDHIDWWQRSKWPLKPSNHVAAQSEELAGEQVQYWTVPRSAAGLNYVTWVAYVLYSVRKITESLGHVIVRGEKRWKEQGGERCPTVCLSMYSITENIYYSQLSSVAILLQREPNCFTSYNTRKELCYLSVIVLRSPPASHVSTSNSQRSSQLFCVHYKCS
jgi:hypothetical protein